MRSGTGDGPEPSSRRAGTSGGRHAATLSAASDYGTLTSGNHSSQCSRSTSVIQRPLIARRGAVAREQRLGALGRHLVDRPARDQPLEEELDRAGADVLDVGGRPRLGGVRRTRVFGRDFGDSAPRRVSTCSPSADG